MKKIITIILLSVFMMISCASPKMLEISTNKGVIIENVKPYGIFNTEEKNEKVAYRVSMGNVIWSVLTIESIFIPVILVGWYLWEPSKVIEVE